MRQIANAPAIPFSIRLRLPVFRISPISLKSFGEKKALNAEFSETFES